MNNHYLLVWLIKFNLHSKQWYENDEEERTVEVSEDELNHLHAAHYFSKKKGKHWLCSKSQKSLEQSKGKEIILIIWSFGMWRRIERSKVKR